MIAVVLILALAQAPPTEEQVEEAKRYFEAGRQAYDATDYEAAVRAFTQANELAPRPAIIFSIAQAYRQQFLFDRNTEHLEKALELYQRYLDEISDGGRRADALRFKEELERERLNLNDKPSPTPPEQHGKTQLMISTRTPSARVALNGSELTEPPLIAEVEPGEHQVRVEAQGFVTFEAKQVAVEGRLVVAEINLREKPAQVRVSAPDGAEVSIDGRFIGNAPLLFPVPVKAGSHFLAVTDRGSHAFVQELSLDRGQEASVAAVLASTSQRDASYYFLGSGSVLFAATLGTAIGALLSEGGARIIKRKIEVDQMNITAKELEDYNRLRELRGTLITVSSACLAGAVGLGVTGGLLYFLDNPGVQSRRAPQSEDLEELTFAPLIGDGEIGAAIGGRF